MKWRIDIVYRMIYTFMMLVCMGNLLFLAFLDKQKVSQIFTNWKEADITVQFGWLLAALLLLGLSFVLLYVCNGYPLLKLLIALGMGGYIGYCFVQNKEAAEVVIVGTLILMIQGILEYLVKDAIYTLPLFLIFGLMLVFCPAKEEPLQWTFVEKAYDQIMDMVDRIGARMEYYGEPKDGIAAFSTASYFAGSIKNNDVEQLYLIADDRETGHYLSGNVYNIYTEQGWRNQITPEAYHENGWNYIQLLTFLKNEGVDKEQVEELCKRRAYIIEYKTIYTKAAFTLLNTVNYKLENGAECEDYKGSTVFDAPKENGFSYKIIYIDVNYSSEILQDMWRHIDTLPQKEYSYEELCQYSMEYFNVDLTQVMSEEEYSLEECDRQQMIAQNYLEVPEHIPDRVGELAKEITKDCQSDYEKMMAVADYLQGYAYNRQPAEMGGDCLIDTFLFDTKEGFCTHFASAMVLLCRSVDIPARYVSGFYLGDKCRSGAFTYHVKGTNAHAWAECYIEGYGFVPVEATPGYASSTVQGWSNDGKEPVKYDYKPKKPQVTEIPDEEKEIIEDSVTKPGVPETLPVFVISIILLAVIILISFLVWGMVCYHRYKTFAAFKQCQILWYIQLQLLKNADMGIQQGETLREYDERLQRKEISDCIAAYEKMKYGKMDCGTETKELFLDGLKRAANQIKGGRIWLLWYFMISTTRGCG